jgi:hypothetical protein
VLQGNLTSNVLGAMVFLDGSLALPPFCCVSVDVVPSDIFDEESRETRLCKINLKKVMARFRLVQALSESNRPTSSMVVLCCDKLVVLDELRAAAYIDWRIVL